MKHFGKSHFRIFWIFRLNSDLAGSLNLSLSTLANFNTLLAVLISRIVPQQFFDAIPLLSTGKLELGKLVANDWLDYDPDLRSSEIVQLQYPNFKMLEESKITETAEYLVDVIGRQYSPLSSPTNANSQ